MFRDAAEELARLEAELLAEEAQEEEELPPMEEAEEEDPWLYEDTYPEEEPEAYQNFSNGYRAYNTDVSDEDLIAYSEEVRRPHRAGCGLAVAAGCLAIVLAVLALFLLARQRGLL